MIKGCYYRCPIAIEENDSEFPRFFVLAQVIEYNELADAIKVKMHDLLGQVHHNRQLRRGHHTPADRTVYSIAPGTEEHSEGQAHRHRRKGSGAQPLHTQDGAAQGHGRGCMESRQDKGEP